ncbi:MAG: PilX N-terminal domain-containing pilus assembly protein [Candidatus Competibacteraceae bacterium]
MNLPNQQKGAVLVVALIILLLVTLIAVSGTNTGSLQLLMSTNEEQRTNAFQSAQAIVDEVTGTRNESALQVCGRVDTWVVDNYPSGDPGKPSSICSDEALALTATGAYNPKVKVKRLAPLDATAPRIRGKEYSAAAFRATFFSVEAQHNDQGDQAGFSRIVQGVSVLVPNSTAF